MLFNFKKIQRSVYTERKKHFKDLAVLAVFLVAVMGIYSLLQEQELKLESAAVSEISEIIVVGGPEIVRGDRDARQVIFTFDGGSGAESGEGILNALEKHGITGTFFLTGKFAEENPELVKKIAREGHEIFNHTYFHPDLTALSDEEIKNELTRADEAIQNLTGKSTKPYFRAPYGARDEHVLKAAAEAGYTSVYWTTDVLDWKESEGMTATAAQARIFGNLQPGAIFLMHIGDTITGTILDGVFSEIKSRGYTVGSLTRGM